MRYTEEQIALLKNILTALNKQQVPYDYGRLGRGGDLGWNGGRAEGQVIPFHRADYGRDPSMSSVDHGFRERGMVPSYLDRIPEGTPIPVMANDASYRPGLVAGFSETSGYPSPGLWNLARASHGKKPIDYSVVTSPGFGLPIAGRRQGQRAYRPSDWAEYDESGLPTWGLPPGAAGNESWQSAMEKAARQPETFTAADRIRRAQEHYFGGGGRPNQQY